MKLTDVSKTAIVTLRSRAIESKKNRPLIHDPMADYCLDRLISLASEDEKARLFDNRLSSRITNYIVLRARKLDAITNDFISKNSGSIVVNLGCGFDTRYWRIDNNKCTYIELDLPEVIEIKREILKGRLAYELIGCSILNPGWIDRVASKGNRNVLLVAEGLFFYLPKVGAINLLGAFSEKFYHSQIALGIITEKYTRGIWKKIFIMKMKGELGLDVDTSHNFSIKKGVELESFGKGIKVIGEWSYVEDPDVRPRIFRFLGFPRMRWIITATINENREAC